MLLVGPLLNDFFQHLLRDERQLAYLVAVKPAVFADYPGAIVAVQSPRVSAQKLLDITRSQLFRFQNYLAALPADRFVRFRAASVRRLSVPPGSLGEVAFRTWQNLSDHAYDADSGGPVAALVATLSKDDVLLFYRRILSSLDQQSVTLVSPGRPGPAAEHAEASAQSDRSPNT